MVAHRTLTGTDLHEPKGVESASSGSVYISDGLGSGAWTNKNSDIFNANNYTLDGDMADIGAAGNSVFFYVHKKSTISKLAAVTYAAIATTNAVLSIYINGVLFADTLTVPFSGSSAGGSAVLSVTTSNTVNAGSVIEVRSDGGPSNSVRACISLLMLNIA